MKIKLKYTGLTIAEVLVAIAIVALLAVGLYSVGSYVETQSKITLTESTIETLVAALDEYHDFYGKFPFEAGTSYNQSSLESATEPNGLNGNVTDKAGTSLPAADYKDVYASGEALYHFLNKCPSSKKIVNSINLSMLTNKDNKNREYFFDPNSGGQPYPLMHIIDPWKTPLRYTYEQDNNFPVITSAGPDKDFGDTDTGKKEDNITSR